MYIMELKCKIMTKGDFYPQLTQKSIKDFFSHKIINIYFHFQGTPQSRICPIAVGLMQT